MVLLKESLLVIVECCRAVLFFSCLLVCSQGALGNGAGGKEGAYAEVSQNLDSATEATGRALYESRCAQCHDANVVRAPQRYILQLSTPEAILGALNDGLMQEVASDLSLPQKTAIAEFLTKRKMSGDDARSAGVACSRSAAEFNRAATPAFSHWGFDQEGTHYIGPSTRVGHKNGVTHDGGGMGVCFSLSCARALPARIGWWRYFCRQPKWFGLRL